jgi:DNA (cytosine-5)-methyltransferase 1
MSRGPRGTEAVESDHLIAFNWQAAGNQTTLGANSQEVGTVGASTTPAVCVTGQQTHALTAIGADASEDGTGRGTPVVFQQNQRDEVREMSIAGALAAEPGMKQQNYLHAGSAVRRLTPRECERLMSWPDDFTRWDDQGNEIADGPRYRMCGNGVVANVAQWLGERMLAYG